jgi:hypothetical protein
MRGPAGRAALGFRTGICQASARPLPGNKRASAYQRASNELAKRRNERRRAASGFESKKRAEAAEERRNAKENRQVEIHKYDIACRAKRLEQQILRTGRVKPVSAAASPGPQLVKSDPSAA